MSKKIKRYCVSYVYDNRYEKEKEYYTNNLFFAKVKFYDICHGMLDFCGKGFYEVSLYDYTQHKNILSIIYNKEK